MNSQTVVYEYFCIDYGLNIPVKCRFDKGEMILPADVTILPDGGLTIEDAEKACSKWTQECEFGYDYEVATSPKKTIVTDLSSPIEGVTFESFLAQKVIFKKAIDDDGFAEKGMMAWLVCVEWDAGNECYELWFDFSEFEERNAKYFRKVFHYNNKLVTAQERGAYDPKCSMFFSTSSSTRDDAAFNREIQEYLHLVEVDSVK